MRNLKSMVAFLVVAAMLFASFTTFAYNDVEADANYAPAVEVLSALEILKGDDKGNFNPDNTITRAEAAAVIVRTLGWEEAAKGAAGATQFTDVAADHWGSGYINMAAQAGIIAGHGDGTFGPEDPVTYEQIVKMLVCALGYEPKALTKGAYPTGYLITANEAKLTAGVSGAAGQEAPRKIVAQLTFNALDIPMMEQEGWGSDISYQVKDGKNGRDYKTLLTEKLALAKVYGKVTDVASGRADGLVTFTVDAGEDNTKNDKIQTIEPYDDDFADEATVEAFGAGYDSVLNLLAYGYFKAVDSKDADYELVAVATVGAEDSVTLAFGEFDFEDDTFIWNDEKDEAALASEVSYYVNGVAVDETALDLIADNAIGSVTLILNDEAEPEVVYVYVDYSFTAIVEEAQVKNNRIKLTEAVEFPYADEAIRYIYLADEEVEELEDVVVSIKDAEGNDVALADLAEDAVLTIKANALGDDDYNQGADIKITVSTATVEGKIGGRKVVDGVANFKIGDKYYVSAQQYYGEVALASGVEGIFYLNAEGEIANVEETARSNNYAILYQIKKNTDDSFVLYTFGKDGLATYTLEYDAKYKVFFDGEYYSEDTLTTLVDTLVEDGELEERGSYYKYDWSNALNANLFFALTINDAGKLSKLERLEGEAVEDAVEFSADYKVLGDDLWLNEDTVIFSAPVASEDASAEDLAAITVADLEDEGLYTYFVVAEEGDAEFIIVTNTEAGESTTAPIAIVTGIETELDEDGDAKTVINYLSDGEAGSIMASFYDDDTADDFEGYTYPVGTVLVIKKTVDGFLANNCKVIGTLAEGEDNVHFTLGDDLDAEDAAAKRKVFFGSIAGIKNNTVTMNVVDTTITDFEKEVKLFKLEEVTTYKYDLSKRESKQIAVADAEALGVNEYDDAIEEYEFQYAVAVLDEKNGLTTLIIIAPDKDVTYGEDAHAAPFADENDEGWDAGLSR